MRRVLTSLASVAAAVAACVVLAVGLPDPVSADTSVSGGSSPSAATIDASVHRYVGTWNGRRSNCAWDVYYDDSLLDRLQVRTPIRKVVGGVEYRLFEKTCPGRVTALVWVGPPSGRRLVTVSRDWIEDRLPRPEPRSAPPMAQGYVGVPTWVWTTTAWDDLSVTAWVPTEGNGTVWATTTARPVRLLLDPGDGSTVVECDGPGEAWSEATDPKMLPECGHVFRHTSLLAPDGVAFRGRLSIVWDVSWRSSTGDGGPLADIVTSSPVSFTVGEIQAVVAR